MSKINTADKGRQREHADKSNIEEELWRKATKPNKEAENSMENFEGTPKFGAGAITKTTCDLKRGWDRTGETLIL